MWTLPTVLEATFWVVTFPRGDFSCEGRPGEGDNHWALCEPKGTQPRPHDNSCVTVII